MFIEDFFKPPSEITQQLIQRINQRRAAALQQEVTNLPPDADDSSESGELQSSIIAALEGDGQVPVDDWEDRRWLSEIIYHFLGRLARRSQRGGPDEFTLNECLVEGMRVRLGLDAPEDASLLDELANDFSKWLVKRGAAGFVAGWARIVIDAQDHQKLCFKPLAKSASPSLKAMTVNATRLDRETESSDH